MPSDVLMLVNTSKIAHAILDHLGGKRFLAMTGARDLLAFESGFSFRLPTRLAHDDITHVAIQLELKLSYTISFDKVSVADQTVEPITSLNGVMPADLQTRFREVTGLAPTIELIA